MVEASTGGKERQFPRLSPLGIRQPEPISFVTIRFSGEYDHNIRQSACVLDPANQLVTVDNRGNLAFENLGQAINHGISQADHDLIVVAHEDVLLPPYWEQYLFRAIEALERDGQVWGLLCNVGWPNPEDNQVLLGHWSDPRVYSNNLQGKLYVPITRIDEQMMVLRRSQGTRCDPLLPSIHNIGRDLPLSLAKHGLGTFVIDAPTIHKYADSRGDTIVSKQDSAKILDRKSYAYRADRAVSDWYFLSKWPGISARPKPIDGDFSNKVSGSLPELPPPVILIARGGGGSRLLSVLARDLGLFIGNQLNWSGDCREMVIPIYEGVIRKYLACAEPQRSLTVPVLRLAATQMLTRAGGARQWGFKLPESLLVLPELFEAFPNARVVQLLRDPLSTCLRRTHMTARLDNQVGRLVLPAAYRHAGRPVERILTDSPALHMAYTTLHQLELGLDALSALPPHRYYQVRFEDVVTDHSRVLNELSAWLGMWPISVEIEQAVNTRRASGGVHEYGAETVSEVEKLLLPLRQRLGYR